MPVFTKPKISGNNRPLASRLSARVTGPWSPWLPGCSPKCGTEHRHRPFIAGNTSTRYEESPVNHEVYDTEEDEELGRVSEETVSTDEIEDEFTNRQNKEQK